jgi:hypothetical protein
MSYASGKVAVVTGAAEAEGRGAGPRQHRPGDGRRSRVLRLAIGAVARRTVAAAGHLGNEGPSPLSLCVS